MTIFSFLISCYFRNHTGEDRLRPLQECFLVHSKHENAPTPFFIGKRIKNAPTLFITELRKHSFPINTTTLSPLHVYQIWRLTTETYIEHRFQGIKPWLSPKR